MSEQLQALENAIENSPFTAWKTQCIWLRMQETINTKSSWSHELRETIRTNNGDDNFDDEATTTEGISNRYKDSQQKKKT